MGYEVSLADVGSRPTAVVAATTTWPQFPRLWGQLLGEVWDCLRAGGIQRGCPNIMLYLGCSGDRPAGSAKTSDGAGALFRLGR